jgi:hypothetical protein
MIAISAFVFLNIAISVVTQTVSYNIRRIVVMQVVVVVIGVKRDPTSISVDPELWRDAKIEAIKRGILVLPKKFDHFISFIPWVIVS